MTKFREDGEEDLRIYILQYDKTLHDGCVVYLCVLCTLRGKLIIEFTRTVCGNQSIKYSDLISPRLTLHLLQEK